MRSIFGESVSLFRPTPSPKHVPRSLQGRVKEVPCFS